MLYIYHQTRKCYTCIVQTCIQLLKVFMCYINSIPIQSVTHLSPQKESTPKLFSYSFCESLFPLLLNCVCMSGKVGVVSH